MGSRRAGMRAGPAGRAKADLEDSVPGANSPVLRPQIGPLLIPDTIFVKGSGSYLPWQNREAWKVFGQSALHAGNGYVMRVCEPRQDRRRDGDIGTHEIVELDNDVGISQMRRLVGIEQLKFVTLAVAKYQRTNAADRIQFFRRAFAVDNYPRFDLIDAGE